MFDSLKNQANYLCAILVFKLLYHLCNVRKWAVVLKFPEVVVCHCYDVGNTCSRYTAFLSADCLPGTCNGDITRTLENTLAFCSLLISVLGNRIIFINSMVVRLINKARHNIYYNALLSFFYKRDPSLFSKKKTIGCSQIHLRTVKV